MHREDLGIGLLILFNQKAPAGIIAKAAWIDAHHVDRRLAIDNPMRQLPTRAACGSDPKTMAFVEPKVFESPCRSDYRRAVGRIRNGAVIDFLDTNFAKGRHAVHSRHDIGFKALKRVREQFIFTIRGRAVNVTSRRANLIRPKQQTAGFLPHVITGIGLAQHTHFRQASLFARHDFWMLFGNQILVLDRNDRNVQPNHRTCLPCEVT